MLTPTTIIAPGARISPPEGHHEGSAGEFPHDGRRAGSGPGYGAPGYGAPGYGAPGYGAPAGPGPFPPPGYGPTPGYEFGPARGDAADPRQGFGGPVPWGAPQPGYPGGNDYARPAGNPGTNGYAGPPGYPAPSGYAAPAGPWVPHGYPAPNGMPGPAGQRGTADWPGSPTPGPGGPTQPVGPPGLNPYGGADGHPGQPAHPAPGGYGYQGPDAYDRTVNGGDYAYVIREEAKAAPPRPGQWGRGNGHEQPGRPAAPAARETRRQADTRAIPAASDGAGSAAQAVPDPDLAYGPDDPAYGPPGPDWYLRSREEPETAQTAPARSNFEPLARSSSGSGTARAEETSAEQAAYPAGGDESPEITDSGFAGPDDSTLGQLRSLYASAERMTPEMTGTDGPDRRFDELLARQRELISEYFKESGGLDAPGPAPREPGAQDAADDSMLSFGTGQRSAW